MATTTALSGQQAVSYIEKAAAARNLDPYAVLAVARQEGLGGGIGDNGSSFGPWQLHVGGAFPTTVGGQSTAAWTPEQKQAWAWSTDGIDYALGRIQGVAAGLQGSAAVSNIVSLFERPANPSAEIAGALSSYQTLAGGGVSGVTAGGGGTATLPYTGGGIGATTLPYTGGGVNVQDVSWLPTDPSSALGSVISGAIGDLIHGKTPSASGVAALIAQPFLAPFQAIGKVFEWVYQFLSGTLLAWLFRGGLIAGGAILVVLGFGLVGKSGIA